MSQPKFTIGQRVIRIHENLGAVVIAIIENNNIIMGDILYCIRYDEGVTTGNDGTGWWPEDSLEPESI